MKLLVLSRSEFSKPVFVNCFRKTGFKEGISGEDADLFSELKSSID